MKTYIFSIIILFFSILNIQAQVSLPDSPKKSAESYIYTINKDNLRKIYLKEEDVSENMLEMQIAKYEKGGEFPFLKRGNYIIVEANENQLNFTDYIVDDLYFKIVPAEKMMLCLHDSLGNIITDAIVKCGSKKLTFDKKSQTYNTSKVKDEQIIEINNKGVCHYIEIEKQDSHYYGYKSNIFKTTWRKTKGLWYNIKSGVHYIFNPEDKPTRNKYTGFIVFNKPKYKPNETVKLKAYMAEYKGKPYNKPVDLQLYSYYPHKIDTILVKDLMPYRPGMYEYQFRLTDSLNLKLDSHYTIALKTKSKRDNEINDRFKYEDYELKSIRFSMTTDKTEYAKGDSVKIKLKVSDENEMALYGGRTEIYVIPQRIEKQKNNETIFIPDTLWTNTIDMNDISEKIVTLPDSIFPLGASLHYRVNCTYLSADNEKKTESKTLYWKANDYIIDFSLSKGMLTIKQLHKGEPQDIEAEISIDGGNNETILSNTVKLPHTLPIPWYASDITVKTKNAKDFYFFDDVEKDEQLGYKFYRQNDSVYLKVDNPAQIPFWYSVRRGKKEIASGYTILLNYSTRDKGKEGYNMQLSYLFGEGNKRIEQSLPYAEKNITLDVSTPTTVYPGQKAKILVSVMDKKQNPIKDVDITAYSFTSKFDNYTMPSIPIKGKASYAKSYKNIKYTPDDASFVNRKGEMTWEKWKNTMALDTIEYYKFLYPETFYKHTEKTPDGSTQILPYVVIDGALQGVHMLWIDEKLYYTNLAQQMDVYTFQINPGKHNLRIRTYDREILVHNIFVEEGAKNIISFNARKAYTKINSENGFTPFVLTSRLLDKKERGILSDKDANYLSSQLITIDNNFGAVELPNVNTTFDLPAYVHSGNTIYYLNQTKRNSYNYTLGTFVNSPILAGPFPTRSFMNGISNIASVYADNKLIGNIELEGGNKYTLYNQYQKIKSWDNLPFNKNLSKYTPTPNFKQEILTPEMVDQYFDKMLKSSLTTLTGSAIVTSRKDVFENNSRLSLFLGKDTKGTDIRPSLIFIIPENKEEIANYKLYYGGTRNFKNLPRGKVKINLVVNDSISYSKNVVLRPNGENYLSIDSIEYEKNNELAIHAFKLLNRNIKKRFTQNPYINQSIQKDSIVYVKSDYSSYSNNNAQKGIVTGTIIDTTGEPLIGVSIIVEGTKNGTVTNLDGQFELTAKQGDKIQITYIGYLPKQIKYSEGASYKIVLEEDSKALQEVVVVGYGAQKRSNLTGSVVSIKDNSLDVLNSQVLQGKVAGVMVRGVSSVQNSEPPLIIVNGLPFNGKLEDLDAASITSMNVLKDASATSIYGARAANGVIMIQTNALSSVKPTDSETGSESVEAGNSMRRNFHDDAFWQPRLKTNEKGEASFEVTYPDDITSWNAYFIAIGNKKQTDKKQMTIKSFKALSGRLSMPRFAIRGDSLNAVGRIANHLGDSININRKIEINGQVQSDNMRLGASFVDHIPVKAEKGDSLSIAYSLQMQNGYFDGEERSIPILEQGMLQTYGDFTVINNSEVHQLKVDPSLGTVTIYAEASSLDLFLREIDKVDKYPYMCNEQMASKIKALLSRKQIAKIFNKEFKDDKKINSLISRLNKNRNAEGLWGWWNRDKTEFWISKQIVSAMLDAEDAGYKTDFDKYTLSIAFDQELKNALSELNLADKKQLWFAKQELLDRLVYLKRMNAPIDYHAYFKSIDSQLKSNTITDKLKTMHAMSAIGLEKEICVDSLMQCAKKTMLGSVYWGDRIERDNFFFRMPTLPYENNIENTLIAYNILKNIGGHGDELVKIQNYFFENRYSGSWQNTYESSRIIETIMPDMLKVDKSFNEVSMYINGKQIKKFPYSDDIESIKPIEIRKEGTLPLFITAYQEAWNKQPDSETKKGFSVKSYFVANKDSISYLTAGKTAQLEVLVNVDADANYVQIEIPIPAGCSYESKAKGSFWNEVHREYFKEKVVIFSNKLSKGEHKFTVDLIARYTGQFFINPVKVELMYFPTFYGNEELKIVDIQ